MELHNDKHQDRPQTLQIKSPSTQRPTNATLYVDDDDDAFDVDEPPEHYKHSNRSSWNSNGVMTPNGGYFKLPTIPLTPIERRESLLTQALSINPESKSTDNQPTSRARSAASMYSNASNASIASTAELTSDGGLTSPARMSTPSPPFPSTKHIGLTLMTGEKVDDAMDTANHLLSADAIPAIQPVGKAEDISGRKRCISFACGGTGVPNSAKVVSAPKTNTVETSDVPKRPCMLRFACPTRFGKGDDSKVGTERKARHSSPAPPRAKLHTPPPIDRHSRKSDLIITGSPYRETARPGLVPASPEVSKKSKAKGSKYNPQNDDDAWTNETPRARPKLTVADTLRKENAIRRIGEEAEEEALEEEKEANEAELEDEADALEGDNDASDIDDDASDGGNESDDEEGFAESDDEDEVDPDYQFWTVGLSTAATSADHMDHIHPGFQRNGSASSIESAINTDAVNKRIAYKSLRKQPRQRPAPKLRPGTPELPDSTDFVCGTLDEDRPLEAAYISCLEQRKLARGLIPQDLDPSFPTSDPDDDEDEVAAASDEHIWVTGRPDESDDGHHRGRVEGTVKKTLKSPTLSPKRLRSPPPLKRTGTHRSPPPPKRTVNHRSPPPRHLFGHSPRRMRSPPPLRDLKSPQSSRRPSISTSPKHIVAGIDVPGLGQRPNLTHTKSLPRTPNPFWGADRKIRMEALKMATTNDSADVDAVQKNDLHSRGPIDIVQGLERKRQKRREKFWRMHCRNPGKEKERRCQPGKGAERMRELGLEMADRCKAYGQRDQVVLSV